MSHIPYIKSDTSVTFYIDGTPYQASSSMPNYAKVLDELKDPDRDPKKLIALVTPSVSIQQAVTKAERKNPDYLPAGKVSVTRSEIRYDGQPVTGVLVERILALLAEGFDIMPMVRFMENLYRNPADFAREELYLWLETSNLPITEDGHFLAYKNVNGDYTSIHDGRTRNDLGTTVSMPRQDVDPNRNRTCSQGLHFCSKSYLPNFSQGRNGKTVLLKINPADVVSIPSDYNNAKGRAWQYEVLSVVDFDPQTKVWPAVVGAGGDDYDFDFDIEDDYDDRDDLLEIPSPLSGALFSALNAIGVKTYEERMEFAEGVLGDEVLSYHDLTKGEASRIIEVAKAESALDTKLNTALASVMGPTRQEKVEEIQNLGIIDLRSRASKAGYPGAWKGPKADELRRWLIARV